MHQSNSGSKYRAKAQPKEAFHTRARARRTRTVLFALIFIVLTYNVLFLAFSAYVFMQYEEHPLFTGRTQNSGYAEFCLNVPPSINISCNSTLSQGTTFFCQLNVTDADFGATYNVTQILNDTPLLNVSRNGTINVTPENGDVGNHTVTFVVTDNSGCANNNATVLFNYSVLNINDPPYLFRTIPAQQIPVNETIIIVLTDYFRDPDNDPMNFTGLTPAGVTVTITGNTAKLSATVCDAEGVLMQFTATDPYNASGSSNLFLVTVKCPQEGSGDDESNTKGGGGGGGGGATNVCKSEWECDDWFACMPTNIQWRHCYDVHGCEREKYLKQDCKYQGPPPVCKENWLCKPWGECLINGTQYRTCEDLKECRSVIARPTFSQQCLYLPTCNDGIKNGNETAIDCGGSCAACPILEKPSIITAESGLSFWLLLGIILSILIVSGIAHYYRARIAQMFAVLGFLLAHRAYKDILLDASQRKSLFERLRAFEQLLASDAGKLMKQDAVYSALATLIRQYVCDALVLKQECLPEEVALRCKEIGVRQETAHMIEGLFATLAVIEQEELPEDPLFVTTLIEELRSVICLTSEYTAEELKRTVEELKVDESMSFYEEVLTRTINIMRAMQFGQLEIARKEYMVVLTRYDPLSEEEKERVYPELQWVFGTLKFQSEITGSRVVKKPAGEAAED